MKLSQRRAAEGYEVTLEMHRKVGEDARIGYAWMVHTGIKHSRQLRLFEALRQLIGDPKPISIDVRNAVHRMTQRMDEGYDLEHAFKTVAARFDLTAAEMDQAEKLLSKYKGLHDDRCAIRYGRDCNCPSAAFRR